MDGEQKENRPHKNVAQIREEDDKKFLYMVAGALIFGGGGIIGLLYGWQGVLTAMPCLLGGAGVIAIPWMLLTWYGRWREKMDEV